MRKRSGFTLIELLIVIVIIGILAAIAIPKLGRTRERAYMKAMTADLRTLGTQQELYYNLPANNYRYASSLDDLTEFETSTGVNISIESADQEGWVAIATHDALPATRECGIFFGTVGTLPAYLTSSSIVSCTGEY